MPPASTNALSAATPSPARARPCTPAACVPGGVAGHGSRAATGRAARSRRSARAGRPRGRRASCSVWYSTPACCSNTKRVQPSSIDGHPRLVERRRAAGAAGERGRGRVDRLGDEPELLRQRLDGAAARSRARAACPPGSGARRRVKASRAQRTGTPACSRRPSATQPGVLVAEREVPAAALDAPRRTAAASVTGSRSRPRTAPCDRDRLHAQQQRQRVRGHVVGPLRRRRPGTGRMSG